MGHREEKKRRIRAAIIENSIALFRERGFDATRVQDIARPLELSDATFFNYFSTKDAVLTEWVQELLAEAFAPAANARAERMRSVSRSAARALAARCGPDAKFLAEIWPRVRQSAGSASPRVRELVAAGQASGDLRGDLPAQQLADLLIAAMLMAIGSWLGNPSAGQPGQLGPRLQGAVDVVLDGSRKRNERVRPPAARSPNSAPIA